MLISFLIDLYKFLKTCFHFDMMGYFVEISDKKFQSNSERPLPSLLGVKFTGLKWTRASFTSTQENGFCCFMFGSSLEFKKFMIASQNLSPAHDARLITSATEFIFSPFVCLSVSGISLISYGWIWMKLGRQDGCVAWINWLDFGVDQDPDLDTRISSGILHHCKMVPKTICSTISQKVADGSWQNFGDERVCDKNKPNRYWLRSGCRSGLSVGYKT